MGKKLPYICIALLALTGLSLAVVPNGMRFTGWLLLGTAAAWAAGMFVVRWGRRSRAGKVCERIFFAGLALGLALYVRSTLSGWGVLAAQVLVYWGQGAFAGSAAGWAAVYAARYQKRKGAKFP